MDEDLQDPLIKDTYANLPWVGLANSTLAFRRVFSAFIFRTAEFACWKDDPKQFGLIFFSAWKEAKLRPYNQE